MVCSSSIIEDMKGGRETNNSSLLFMQNSLALFYLCLLLKVKTMWPWYIKAHMLSLIESLNPQCLLELPV